MSFVGGGALSCGGDDGTAAATQCAVGQTEGLVVAVGKAVAKPAPRPAPKKGLNSPYGRYANIRAHFIGVHSHAAAWDQAR